jgi:hypothetical protein
VSPQENSQQLEVTTDGSMIDDVAGFAVHSRNYETGHQVAKSSSVFSAEIYAIRMALDGTIQRCPRDRYLIMSDTLSSLMAVRSRRITCKAYSWVYVSKQIYWDLQQLLREHQYEISARFRSGQN